MQKHGFDCWVFPIFPELFCQHGQACAGVCDGNAGTTRVPEGCKDIGSGGICKVGVQGQKVKVIASKYDSRIPEGNYCIDAKCQCYTESGHEIGSHEKVLLQEICWKLAYSITSFKLSEISCT